MEEREQRRLFIAIPACDEVVIAGNLLKEKNAELHGTKWVPAKNLHLTVFFLGDVAASHIPEILSIMESVLAATPSFNLETQAITLEGARAHHPSMVWARFKMQHDFANLVQALSSRLVPFMKEPPKFSNPVPHITLARIRSGPLPEINIPVACVIPFSGYELWESRKMPAGVEYPVVGKKYFR